MMKGARSYGKRLHARVTDDGWQELWWLVGLVGLAALGWAFVEIAGVALEGDPHALDRQILLSLRTSDDLGDPTGPLWVEDLVREFTTLGGSGFLTLATLLTAGALLLARKPHAAWALVIAVGLGIAASFLMKAVFGRPRPDLVPHISTVYTRSFPSGHSMVSTLTYLTLAAVSARQTPKLRLKLYFFGCAILLAALIGFSRIYLGVHWPTDVLAGWAAGAFWALLCWIVVRWLQSRGQVEEEAEEGALPFEKSKS